MKEEKKIAKKIHVVTKRSNLSFSTFAFEEVTEAYAIRDSSVSHLGSKSFHWEFDMHYDVILFANVDVLISNTSFYAIKRAINNSLLIDVRNY